MNSGEVVEALVCRIEVAVICNTPQINACCHNSFGDRKDINILHVL